jgi:hypothetical protein
MKMITTTTEDGFTKAFSGTVHISLWLILALTVALFAVAVFVFVKRKR